jgi:hypothetical protein
LQTRGKAPWPTLSPCMSQLCPGTLQKQNSVQTVARKGHTWYKQGKGLSKPAKADYPRLLRQQEGGIHQLDAQKCHNEGRLHRR